MVKSLLDPKTSLPNSTAPSQQLIGNFCKLGYTSQKHNNNEIEYDVNVTNKFSKIIR